VSELTVIATAKAKPGKEKELERILRASLAPTHEEPGNLHFSLHRAIDDPSIVVAIERWASKEAWNEHFTTPHIEAVVSQTKDLLAEPPRVAAYELLPEGSSEKGRL
jgi:quinol monooxygenase YgiN